MFVLWKFIGRASLQDWALIFYGTASPADKNDPSPYSNVHYKINISQSVLVPSLTMTSNKNRNKNNGKSQANGNNNLSTQYIVSSNGNTKKNKNVKNQHRNSQGKNKSSIRPTVTSLRGITNKTSSYNRQYGNGKGPQRQTDSSSGLRSSNGQKQHFAGLATERPRHETTLVSGVTKNSKLEKTTKLAKNNNQDTTAPQYAPKFQKNVSKQPSNDLSSNLKSDNPSYKVESKKSDSRLTTEDDQATTRPYHESTVEMSTNPPNFRGFIFVDQPPDGHVAPKNSRIPSLFQKYPKIQHIYPALFPYPKVEGVGNKPSRQHPPLSQFHPELFLGGLAPKDSLDSEMDRDHHESSLTSEDKGIADSFSP